MSWSTIIRTSVIQDQKHNQESESSQITYSNAQLEKKENEKKAEEIKKENEIAAKVIERLVNLYNSRIDDEIETYGAYHYLDRIEREGYTMPDEEEYGDY